MPDAFLTKVKIFAILVAMYRYSDQKNRRDNRRFKAATFNRRRGIVKKIKHKNIGLSSKNQNKKKNSQRRAPNTSKASIKQQPAVMAGYLVRLSVWWKRFWRFICGFIFVIGLAALSFLLCMNSFLPMIFELDKEYTIMLVEQNQAPVANKLYLLHFHHQASRLSLLSMNEQMLIPIAGQYGEYPLSTVASFLEAEGSSAEEIRKIYNLAFGQVIDQIFFLKKLPTDLKHKNQLKQVFHQYFFSAVKNFQPLGKNFFHLYFAVRSYNNFNFTVADDLTKVQTWSGGVTDKSQFIACPLVLINATESRGLANRVSQILEQNGLEVRHLGSSSESTGSSSIYYDDSNLSCTQAVNTVLQILPKDLSVIPDGGQMAKKHRAKTVIILGKALAQ